MNPKYSLVWILPVVILMITRMGMAKSVSDAFMLEEEYSEIDYVVKRSGQRHAQASTWMERSPGSDAGIYKLLLEGKGNYERYKEVRWTATAVMKEKDARIYTKKSHIRLRNKNDELIKIYEKLYDYENKKVVVREFDGQGNVIKRKVFPIKGLICDDVTISHFLKIFAANRGQKHLGHFYLLTNEPKLYKVNVYNRGVEDLKLPIGNARAVKLQLIGDMGPLTKLIIRFIPPTYFWYTDQYPYDWLQYEGKESGLKSSSLMTYVTNRVPAITIH